MITYEPPSARRRWLPRSFTAGTVSGSSLRAEDGLCPQRECYYAMLDYVMLCYVMSCYVVLCYVIV